MADFGRLIKKVSAQMSRNFGHFGAKYGLTAVQMSLIDFLCIHKHQEILQRDIEDEFIIRRSTASVLLRRMERRGLIIRKPSREDARQRQVLLTSKSLRLEAAIVKYMRSQQAKLQKTFSPAEMSLLNRLMQTLLKINS